jgi:hypothetical protein
VPVIGNTISESNETFLVNLSSPVNATLADGQAVGSILDNDRVPGLSIDDITVTEGQSGTSNAVFTVRLAKASERIITVGYSTSNHTAHAGTDFLATNGILTFTPGMTNQSVSVAVIGDTVLEPTKDFFVVLTNAANATMARGRGVCTILDGDFPIAPNFHPAGTGVITNGLVSDFKITSARIDGTNVVISFPTISGRSIRIEYSDGLGSTIWLPVPGATNIVGNGEAAMAVHTNGVSQSMRLYRGRLSQ